MDKKVYKLPVLNKVVMALTLAVVFIAAVVVGFIIGRNYLTYTDASGSFTVVILPLLVAVVVVVLLRPLYMRTRLADLSGGRLRITTASGREFYDGALQNVHTVLVGDFRGNYILKIWDRQSRMIFAVTCNILTPKKGRDQAQAFAAELIRLTGAEKGEVVTGNKFRNPGVYYHSTMFYSTGSEQALAPEGLKKRLKGRNRKAIVIVVVALVAFMAAMIWTGAASKGFYEIDDDVVTFRGKPVEGAVAQEFRTLTYLTGKDSSYVYFRGKRQEGLDAHTMRSLNAFLLADRNGIYREPSFSVFSSGLKRVEGVDYATFRVVGQSLFADRSSVFYVDPFASNPIVAVSCEPLPDPATTQEVGIYFFKDASRVFFLPNGGARPRCCPEIDATSFEQVSWRVYKDGGHVYFVTKNLQQEGGNKQVGYDLLRGADAPTFRMIDDTHFEDRNTTWNIEKE